MRKLVSILAAFVLFTMQTFAQEKTVTGKVTDEKDGAPIAGVSVTVGGTNTGTTTAADGSFSLTVPSSAKVLIFSFINYASQEVTIGNKTSFAIKLSSEEKSLAEVVVVGYGTQTKKNLTGSVARLKDKTLQDIPLQGPDQALGGRVPGVLVTQSSGTPGSSINVLIRGAGSISNSNQPLYVVDGIIINTGSYSQLGVGGQTLNALSEINPNDIESFDILKDAAATAIYGARGANGVVLITTKRGANRKTAINFSASYGTQKAWRIIKTASGPEYVAYIQEAAKNLGLQTGNPNIIPSSPGVNYSGLDNNPSTYPTTNWMDEIFRSAPISNYDLSFRGGNDKTKFFISGGYFDQGGTLVGSDYKRYSTRINLDNTVSNKFKISTSFALSRSVQNRINNDNNIYGVLSSAILVASYFPAINPNGTYARDPNNGTVESPLVASRERYNRINTNRVLAAISGEYTIIPGLTLKSQFSTDYIDFNEAQFLSSITLEGAGGPNGIGREGYNKELALLNENTLTYTKTIADKHNFTFTGVASFQESRAESIFGEGKNFPGNSIQRLSASSVKSIVTSTGTSVGFIGYLARLNYSFDGKYLITANIRRDGTSKLGKNFRWGSFPGVSVAWRASEENFLKNISFISDLKIRASYGINGSVEGLGNFASLALVGVGANYPANLTDVPGLAPSQIGNDSLKWEQSKQIDIGFDIAILKNRVQLIVDLFKKSTSELLLNRPLVGSSGFTGVNQNIGEVENKGLEIGLNTTNIDARDFKWNTSLNISFIKNKVVKISGSPFAAGFASWVEAGNPLGSFRGYKVAGIFQTQAEITASPVQLSGTRPGDIKFVDINKDGRINADDQTILGNAQPKFFGGITNTFAYKGVELSVFMNFSYGNKVWNHTRVFAEGMNNQFGQFASITNRWVEGKNTNTSMPRAILGDPNQNRRNSDRFLEDGSFMRIKNLILSYNLPQSVLKKIRVNNLKVFVQSQNLVTWTKYTGFDPEVSAFSITNTAPGTDFLTYPQAKSFSGGISISF
jgi:TonB-dependent starch-binding outer membrane protein SusC